MREKPDYLDQAPYSPELKDFLKELNGRVAAPAAIEFNGEMDRLDYVEQEIVIVLKDLATLVASLGNADHSEKLQVAKARAGLIEKLVAAREKVWTMKGMADFQAKIMVFLAEICTADQVQELKERVRGAE
ncbi:MAG: hypothetical protein EOR34_10480 [Mesorhizobium sp.]|uniref:hypothetical protein n=1 Tax=Mesorhizobium sp. TaxID=1871066 RepID=UPI000FEA6480|nr:hypothetical protein [Mesorhizobium sp.]RWH49628.1 MAG: hypothetical protein EOQ80_06890 [Mesorhizobium sp.]RWI48434.1 MAG: hypothetical protein EOR15_13810 [Mesorhizobium sp.]RWI88185.1 MAG: hypothetical protein EOR20_03865 [Mesorhizobium sp.]RWJ60057.1 MAG: hypothetical protein EOR32_19400 [Mesorhizobium sp.]RWJ74307.1 MAG: hypothetical protein EOR34_10480 [Mesorhizobium sp.]